MNNTSQQFGDELKHVVSRILGLPQDLVGVPHELPVRAGAAMPYDRLPELRARVLRGDGPRWVAPVLVQAHRRRSYLRSGGYQLGGALVMAAAGWSAPWDGQGVDRLSYGAAITVLQHADPEQQDGEPRPVAAAWIGQRAVDAVDALRALAARSADAPRDASLRSVARMGLLDIAHAFERQAQHPADLLDRGPAFETLHARMLDAPEVVDVARLTQLICFGVAQLQRFRDTEGPHLRRVAEDALGWVRAASC